MPSLDDLVCALTAWGLAGAALERVPAGSVNAVYQVESGVGVAFLRVYRNPDPAVVVREHALIGRVRAAGFPAVAPLPTQDGRSYTTHAGSVLALYPQARGEQVPREQLTERHAQSAGVTLAALHAALDGEPDHGYRTYRLAWTAAAWIERLHAVERAILNLDQPSETDLWALARLRAQRDWLAHPDCLHAYAPAFPARATHGDYHDGNLFFDAGGVSAVIDWEQAAWMPRAFELVRACAYMFGGCPALGRGFLQAYQGASGLGAAELAGGARAWGVMSDHHVWALEEVYLHGNDRAKDFIPHRPFRPFHEVWEELSG